MDFHGISPLRIIAKFMEKVQKKRTSMTKKRPLSPSRGAAVWTEGREGLAAPLSLETLAAASSGWAESIERFAPWREEDGFAISDNPQAPEYPVLVCGACASSLDAARTFVDEGRLPVWGSVLAVSQTSGRGQLRRNWFSPPGNIYAALAWPEAHGAFDVLAPLLAGLMVAEFLETLGFEAQLKWPNDILVGGCKTGGILLEERKGRVLAGIGLNLASAPPPEFLRENRAVPATALAERGLAADPLGLWSALVKFGQSCYDSWASATYPGAVISRLERRLAFLGRDVWVRETETAAYRARILGLAGDGGLRLARQDNGYLSEMILHSGGVTPL
jgi:BirA family transcriptional regulator, biotin operon repressor / biotin---[acetyl-CoA-carboxylase] ligase